MHVRYNNQYKTGADRRNILGQPMLFECMGICVLSPVHESEMRAYLVCVLIVVLQLRAVFRPSVQYLLLFCEAFS